MSNGMEKLTECIRCGWIGTEDQKLSRPNPGGHEFNVLTCPLCGGIIFYQYPHPINSMYQMKMDATK